MHASPRTGDVKQLAQLLNVELPYIPAGPAIGPSHWAVSYSAPAGDLGTELRQTGELAAQYMIQAWEDLTEEANWENWGFMEE